MFLKIVIKSIILMMVFLLPISTCVAETKTPDIVNSEIVYTHEILTKDLEKLALKYPEVIAVKSLGKTLYGRDIWAVRLGNGETPVLFTGAIHAREWITTVLLMKTIEEYAKGYQQGNELYGYKINKLLNDTSIWVIPMVNPDGVTLEEKGVQAFPQQARSILLRMNEGQNNFDRWKANAQGIDINRQFPADWENANKYINKPNYKDYKGEKSLEALEARVLADFSDEIQPEIEVNYHSAGNIIYWHSNYTTKKNLAENKRLAQSIADLTSYGLIQPIDKKGLAGFQDYFLKKYNRPSLTIEVSGVVNGKHVPLSEFSDIWERNKKVMAFIAQQSTIIIDPISSKVLINGAEKEFDTRGHWAEQDILIAVQKGIVNGVNLGVFLPNKQITRAEFCAMLVNALNLPAVKYSIEVKDIKESAWYADSVTIALESGLMKGYGINFSPSKKITREEMAAVFVRVLGKTPVNTSLYSINVFEDVNKVSSWAKDSMKQTVGMGLITGKTAKILSPKSESTRAEAVAMVLRMLKIMGR